MTTTQPTITYFPLRGRAEVIRLIFEELGESYVEVHISPTDWEDCRHETPLGGLPVYSAGPALDDAGRTD